MNAFTMVRPKGTNPPTPSPVPRKTNKTNKSKAPAEGNVHEVLAMDRTGRRTVSLERRPSGITIENREQSAASLAKTQRIKGSK